MDKRTLTKGDISVSQLESGMLVIKDLETRATVAVLRHEAAFLRDALNEFLTKTSDPHTDKQ